MRYIIWKFFKKIGVDMKKFISMTLLVLSVGVFVASFSGCERNDYQHPLQRSNN